MGRKKKKKPKKHAAAAQAASAPPAAEAPSAVVEPSKDDASKVEPPTPAAPAPAPPVPSPSRVEEPVASLDDDVDSDDYQSLVAAVANMRDDEPAAPRAPTGAGGASTRTPPPPKADDVEEVHDLDDDLDTGSVHRLIAQVGRKAPAAKRVEPEEEEEAPLIDLDADEPVLPKPAGPRLTAGSLPAVTPAADPRPGDDGVSRLARAAAAGAADDDDVPTVSLDYAEVSTPEARARLLAEALAHAEHKEARYRVPLADDRRVSRLKSAIAAAILLLAMTVAVAPPAWVRLEPPAQLTEGARARGIRMALLLQAEQVEAYRVRNLRLPERLEDLPVVVPGVRYARSGNRAYQLVAYEPDGSPIVYDSANPAPPFRLLVGTFSQAEVGR